MKDPHEVLGVPIGADAQEIKRAYLNLAKQHHPDLNPSPASAQKFLEIQQASKQLLGGSYNPLHHNAQALRKAWEAEQAQAARHIMRGKRSVSTTLALCAAAIAGGVALFFGAVWVHDGLYTHNIYKPRDDEGKQPNPLQLEIQHALRQEMAKQRREDGER